MTKLRDVPLIRESVELSSGHVIELRGINASDLILLTTMFGPQIALAYGKFKDSVSKGPVTEHDLMSLVMAVMNDSPKFLGWIIALANDDPTDETARYIASFPAVDQAIMIEAITRQTFANEATVKKLAASLSGIYQTISGVAKNNPLKPSSPNGTGPSVVQ